jgi:HK97 family phage major capsid protein/HK97 family phage prohead protease
MADKALGESVGGGGSALVPPVNTNVQCPRCGHSPMAAGGVCPQCGYKLGTTEQGGEPNKDAFQIDFDIKSVTEDEKGTLILKGYGSTWIEDRDEETVVKTAFSESLDEFLSNPVLLLGHDKKRLIGRVTYASPDNKGLAVIAEVPKPPVGSEAWHIKAYADIKNGLLKAFSIGGRFIRDASRKFIEKVHLYELSVIPVPANPTSLFEVVGMKSWRQNPVSTTARARHRHANGVKHRHKGGSIVHKHRSSKAVAEAEKEAYLADDLEDGDDLYDEAAEKDIDFDFEGKAAWTAAYINDLPDSSFAYIEPGGTKDDEGKTTPRSLRHFPYKDASGTVDLPHLRNALARAPQSPFGDKAMPKLRAAASAAGVGERELAEISVKGGSMAEAGTKEAKIEIDAKEWEQTQATINALVTEKQARDKEAEVDKQAKERIAAEEKAAKDEQEAKAKRDAEVKALVDERIKAIRAGTSGGTKHQWSGDGRPTGGDAKEYRLSSYMRDLVRSKHGDFDAFKRLKDRDEEAANSYKEAGYEIKAYSEGTNTAGGFLVPPQYLQEGIAEFRIAQAKVRQLCTVIRGINSNSVLIPRETGISSVGWTAENAAKPATDATYGQISVGIYTLAGISKVSRQLLEDSSPAVDALVRRGLGKALGQAEDIAAINGTGTGQPTGILNTAGILTGAVGTKLWSSIAGAISSVQSNYFANPTAILAHPRDVNTLRTTTDTAGRPIFLPNYFQGAGPAVGGAAAFLGGPDDRSQSAQFPMSIAPDGYVFGLPVYSDANIPTNLGGGTNETRMIIGDFTESYFFERVGMNMDVSSEAGTSFEQNQIWFRAEERVGFTAARQPSAIYVMTGLTPGAGL